MSIANRPDIAKYQLEYLGDTPIQTTNMSEIWLAHRTTRNATKTVILKFARQNSTFDLNQSAIENEVEWLSRLHGTAQRLEEPQHGIVKLLPIMQARTNVYIVKAEGIDNPWFTAVEYLASGSLKDWLSSGQSLDLSTSLHIIKGLADTLNFIHKQNCVHMDIKPDNVMFRGDSSSKTDISDSTPILIDFGMARKNKDESNIGGVDNWLAPECNRLKRTNEKAIIHPTMDIFPVGLLLHYLITQQHPRDYNLESGNVDKQKRKVIGPEHVPSALVASSVKHQQIIEALNDLIDDMQHDTPKKRPSGARISGRLQGIIDSIPSNRQFDFGRVLLLVASLAVVLLMALLLSWGNMFNSPTTSALSLTATDSVSMNVDVTMVSTMESTITPTLAKEPTATTEPVETANSTATMTVGSVSQRTQATMVVTSDNMSGDATEEITDTPTDKPAAATKKPSTPTSVATSTHTATPSSTSTTKPTSTRAPTSTRVPTSTRTPTFTPTVTRELATLAPTAQPIARSQPTPTFTVRPVSLPTAVRNAAPTAVLLNPSVQVTLLSPQNNLTTSGRVDFVWQATANLNTGEGYEVALWDPNQDPNRQNAFGLHSAMPQQKISIDLAQYHGFHPDRLQSGYLYHWGVRIWKGNTFVWVSDVRKITFMER